MKRLLVAIFIFGCIFSINGKASAEGKVLTMLSGNILKLQIADLEAELLKEKYLRAQDRKRLIKVLDLWEHDITYTDANLYTFDQRTGRYVKMKEEVKKKLEPKDIDGAKEQESKDVKETIKDKTHTDPQGEAKESDTDTQASDKKPPEEKQEAEVTTKLESSDVSKSINDTDPQEEDVTKEQESKDVKEVINKDN